MSLSYVLRNFSSDQRSHYDILGVDSDASLKDIKKAYISMCKKVRALETLGRYGIPFSKFLIFMWCVLLLNTIHIITILSKINMMQCCNTSEHSKGLIHFNLF